MSEKIQLKNLKSGTCGIYKLTYPNGKIYIGQSIDIKRRMYEHNNTKRLNNHHQSPCDLAILKYGKFEEIEILDYCKNKEELNQKEQYWIAYYKSNEKDKGYNLTIGGDNSISIAGERHNKAVFTNEQVYDIRKRRFEGERKKDVYKDYQNINFSTFEHVWLGRGYNNIGKEFFIEPHSISIQEYGSTANSGENNHNAKLTEKDVREIRYRYDNGEKVASIQKDFNCISKGNLRKICKREIWKNVI